MTEILPTILMAALFAMIGGAIGYYACYRKNKAMIARIKDDNKRLKHGYDVFEATTHELRSEKDQVFGRLWSLRGEFDKLLEVLRVKERMIENLRASLDERHEELRTPTFHEGDQVVISRSFFDEEEGPDLHGTIHNVSADECIVLIVEEGSIYDDVEFVVGNEFITKA